MLLDVLVIAPRTGLISAGPTGISPETAATIVGISADEVKRAINERGCCETKRHTLVPSPAWTGPERDAHNLRYPG